MQEVTESSLCLPMTEEDAKKILKVYNKFLLNNSNIHIKKLGKFGTENIDNLAEKFVKDKCKGILENDGNGQKE